MKSMTWNDYKAQVKQDAINAIEELIGYRDGKFFVEPSQDVIDQYDRTIDVDELVCLLQDEDSVTGNGSGSYTMNALEAEKNLACVIWSDEFREMVETCGLSLADMLENGPETLDVMVRCWVLGEVALEVAEAIAERHGLEVIN